MEPTAREASSPGASPPERGERSDAAGGTISGVVLGPDGAPLRRASVKFAWTDRGRPRYAHAPAQEGRFELALDDAQARGDLLAYVHEHRLAPAALLGVERAARAAARTGPARDRGLRVGARVAERLAALRCAPVGRVRVESGELALECDVRAGETTEVSWPP